MLLQIAEARRMHGTSERDGTVHQVWRQGKEQKVRLNIGKRPDGSPWLSPWIKVEDHHGSLREQQKFHKGQNVKMTTPGADFSQAKVTASGENQAHPEPQHATDYHETSQYASARKRIGPDFEERWMASGGKVSGQDPDKVSTVLERWGAKPQDQEDKNQPWDGPDPDEASPKKRILKWVGDPGNTPNLTGDAIVKQFDKDTKIELTTGSILKKVQSSDGGQMSSPDAGDGTAMQTSTDHIVDGVIGRIIHNTSVGKTTSTVHKNGDITHIIQDISGNITQITQQMNQIIHQVKSGGQSSYILHQAEQIMHQVGQSTLQITSGAININSPSLNLNTSSVTTPSSINIPQVNSSGDAPAVNFLWDISAWFKAELKKMMP
jgi:hypothetical protein